MRKDSSGSAIQVGTFIGAPTIINLSVTTSTPVLLSLKTCYSLWASVDCFFQFGGVAVTATISSNPMKAGLDRLHWVDFHDTAPYAGATTGNAANTENTGSISLKTASQGRNIYLEAAYVIGRANALTTISGMAFRIVSFTTASTGGTGVTPTSKDVTANETATAVGVSGQTVSVTGRKQHVIFGCGAAGPGGYVAQNPAARVFITPNATAPSLDMVHVSTTASLTYEWSLEHSE